MRSPIVSAYNLVDNALMAGVGTIFKSYNWLTGDTKTGFANKLITISPIFRGLGAYNSANSVNAGVNSFFIHMILNVLFVGVNNNIERREAEASKKHMLDPGVEINKKWIYPFGGGFSLAHAAKEVPLIYFETDSSAKLASTNYMISYLMESLAFYIMRLDNLPPRKDLFSRQYEKVKEILSEKKAQVVPQLARNRSYLEEIFGV